MTLRTCLVSKFRLQRKRLCEKKILPSCLFCRFYRGFNDLRTCGGFGLNHYNEFVKNKPKNEPELKPRLILYHAIMDVILYPLTICAFREVPKVPVLAFERRGLMRRLTVGKDLPTPPHENGRGRERGRRSISPTKLNDIWDKGRSGTI
jgi:hypothetical protein